MKLRLGLVLLFLIGLVAGTAGCNLTERIGEQREVGTVEKDGNLEKDVMRQEAAMDEGNCVYVAVDGDDNNDGSKERPFATLNRALAATRKMKLGEKKYIIIRGGNYYDVKIQLGSLDSGLTIQAAGGEKPVLYGGKPITGWEKEGDCFYSAKLPSLDGKSWDFRMLLVNDEYRPRARLPEVGYFEHESRFPVSWLSSSEGGWARKPTHEELTTLKYKEGDLGAWLDVKSAEVQVLHSWDDSIVGLESIDEEARILRFSSEATHPPGGFSGWIPHAKYYAIWNIKEGMHKPGNWYLDRTEGKVVYWPKEGEDMDSIEVIAPTTQSIIEIKNNFHLPLQNITIEGIELAVTNAPLKSAGFGTINLDGAIMVSSGIENLTLRNLTIRNTGGWAIKAENTQNLRIEGCTIHSLGGGGIRAMGQNVVIKDNRIEHIGLDYPSSIAIFFKGEHSEIRNNEISGGPYSGINCGGKDLVIEENIIERVMQELVDGAAIYVGWAENVTLRKNIARDIDQQSAHAYYLDEQTTNSIVEDNLAVNIEIPLHNHMAEKNLIRNNVCISDKSITLSFSRCKDFTVEKNIFYTRGDIIVRGINAIISMPNNIFFSQSGNVQGQVLEHYNIKKTAPLEMRDGSIQADPLFTDIEKGDYSFQAKSPAAQMGIKPIDVSGAGRSRK